MLSVSFKNALNKCKPIIKNKEKESLLHMELPGEAKIGNQPHGHGQGSWGGGVVDP